MSFQNVLGETGVKAPDLMQEPASRIGRRILDCLAEYKGEDVLDIDIRGKSFLADTLVLASGRSRRHVRALAEQVVHTVKKNRAHLPHTPNIEGLSECNWVVIDAGDVITHIFVPEVRLFYNLERLWLGDSAGTAQ